MREGGERRRRGWVRRLGLGSCFLRLGAFHACHSYKAQGNNETVWRWIKKNLFRELTRESVREYERAKEGGRCCSRLTVEIRLATDIQLPREVYLASFSHLSSVSTWGARQKEVEEEGCGKKDDLRGANFAVLVQQAKHCKYQIK